MAGRARKRKTKAKDDESTGESEVSLKKIPCKYGSSCYRKNEQHLQKYSHEKEDFHAKGESTSIPEDQEDTSEAAKEESVTQAEEENIEKVEVPLSPENVQESIKQKFLFEMPEDFYKFWKFCQTCNPSAPEEALQPLLGLSLVGPYDVLAGKLKNKTSPSMERMLCHWRYFYDPPEFQTVIRGNDSTHYHIGYYRNLPSELPVFVASNEAAIGCEIKDLGGNIFAAVNLEINKCLKKSKGGQKQKLEAFQKKMQTFVEDNKIILQSKSLKRVRSKERKYVSKTFHKAGIVVPLQGDVGYRALGISDGELKTMLKKISESKTEQERDKNFDQLQSLITNIQFANDECDYSMGYELGINLFCFGDESFHSTILFLLTTAYELLGWPEYSQIIKAHLASRKKGTNLSVISR